MSAPRTPFLISLPWLEIFLLRRIANAAEEVETYDISSEVPRLYPDNNMSVTIIIFGSFFLVKLVTIHFLYLLLIHPILPSCLLSVSSSSSSWSAFLELFKIFNISTNCSWLSSAFLRRISTLYFFSWL
jgi:hypothetical protein